GQRITERRASPRRSAPDVGSALRELVEALGPAGQDLALRRLGELRARSGDLRRPGEEPVGVRVVRRPEDLVRADVLGKDAEAALDRLEGDPAVAAEEGAGVHLESGGGGAAVLRVALH